jgi:hypothetical protein
VNVDHASSDVPLLLANGGIEFTVRIKKQLSMEQPYIVRTISMPERFDGRIKLHSGTATDYLLIVRNHDDSSSPNVQAFGEGTQCLSVQKVGGLVQNNQVWNGPKGSCQHQLNLLPSRKSSNLSVGSELLGETKPIKVPGTREQRKRKSVRLNKSVNGVAMDGNHETMTFKLGCGGIPTFESPK